MPDTQYTAKHFWLLFLLAALTFLTAFQHFYVAEEAVFPITSMEMWQRGEWLKQYRFGIDVNHNPLFNWLIIPWANLIGWPYMLQIARALTIAITLSTAAMLAWLSMHLYKDRVFAAMTALVYISCIEVLMYHGWLAYVDPLFGFFIFTAIATLWIGCIEQRRLLIWLSVASISFAFLAKAQTAFVFYAVSLAVLGRNQDYRKTLLAAPSVIALLLALAVPVLWYGWLVPHGVTQGKSMFGEILEKFSFDAGLGGYLSRLIKYPLEVWVGFFPASLLAAYLLLRKKFELKKIEHEHFFNALLIVGINCLPYWLSPQGPIRYLIPLYPLFALVMARIIWLSGNKAIAQMRLLAIGSIAFNLLLGLIVFPYYQQHYRGANYASTAADIDQITQGNTVYTRNATANSMSVIAYLNQRRYPQKAIQWAPEEIRSGYIIAMTENEQLGKTVKEYLLGGDKLYLLCRGSACELPTK